MRNLSLILLAAITASALAFPASAQAPPKKKGQTIFGENRKATMKAMLTWPDLDVCIFWKYSG